MAASRSGPARAEGAIRSSRFTTQSPERGAEYLRDLYVEHTLTVDGETAGFRFDAEHLQIGSVFLSAVRTTMPVRQRAPEGVTWPAVVSGASSDLRVERGSATYAPLRQGPVHLGRDEPFDLRWSTIRGTGLDQEVLLDLAGAALDDQTPLTFAFGPAVSPSAGRQWARVRAHCYRVGLAHVASTGDDLLADQLGRLLAGATLSCFGNASLDAPGTAARSGGPASLHRGVAFLEANLERPVSLTEVAQAARVSPRALTESFRRHLGTTPMAYLRRARLACAHEELRAARPGDGTTVTAVAAHWGFHSLPRFGVLHRRAYGTPPSRTLRSV